MIEKSANDGYKESDWTSFLTSYKNNSAIFFTEVGILVNTQEKTPVISFQETLQKLNVEVNTFHLLDSTVILKCELPLPKEELLKLNYQIFSVN